MTAPEPRALPGTVSAIRLTYTCEQSWWDTGEDEPEIWHVAADLYDLEGDTSVGASAASSSTASTPMPPVTCSASSTAMTATSV
ncbi:hypothetical protein [Streptomyces sp. C10-9-1]|uniref:hypothetical protein n=1 Tax=Streptomyces sp. C10-9-1 TaxID=1859285 RepID=UPI003F49C7F2